MKVLAINASPNGTNGNTGLILEPFLDGMKNSGANVDLVNLDKLSILPCRACTGDLYYEPKGDCRCEDDMALLYPKFKQSDIWVFATPNYYDSIVPKLKRLLDRMEPLFSIDDNELHKGNFGKLAFVSTCDMYEVENFNIMVDHFRSVSRLFARDYSGALLRPHASTLAAMKEVGAPVDDIFSAAKEAGKQLVSKGAISREVLEKVSRKLVSKKSFFEELNNYTNNRLSLV